MTLRPMNNFVLVDLKLKDEAENGFIMEDELKGDGAICKCIVAHPTTDLKAGLIVYVPFYALRQIKEHIYACDYNSIICYEDEVQ